MRFARLLCGIACVVTITQPSAQSSESGSVSMMLDRYLAGDFGLPARIAGELTGLTTFAKEYPTAAAVWISQDPVRISSRRLTAGALVLEISRARYERRYDGWYLLAPDIEWACEQLRRDASPALGEEAWQRAVVALALRTLDSTWLVGVPDDRTRQVPRHLYHAMDRFRTNPWFELANLEIQTEKFLVDGDLDSRAKMRLVSHPGITKTGVTFERERTLGAIRDFGPLVTDAQVGGDAEVRIAHLYYDMYDYENAVNHARRAASVSHDAVVAYQAGIIEAQALERLNRVADASRAYAAALAAVPDGQSASLGLSSWLVLSGQSLQADDLVQRSLAAHGANDDPWRLYPYGDYARWPALIADVHRAIK